MATVWIPPLLRQLTDQHESLTVEGATVGLLIDNLEVLFPAINGRLRTGESLRPGISVVIDGQVARDGLAHPVHEQAEVHFIPAIGGG